MFLSRLPLFKSPVGDSYIWHLFTFESKNNSKAILISLCQHKPTPRTTPTLWSSYSSQFLRPSVGGGTATLHSVVLNPLLGIFWQVSCFLSLPFQPLHALKGMTKESHSTLCFLTLRLPFSKAPSSYQIWKTESLTKQPPHLPIKSELPSVMVVDSFQSRISLVSDLLNCTLYVAIYAARGLWPLHEFCEMNFHSIFDFDLEFARHFSPYKKEGGKALLFSEMQPEIQHEADNRS